MGREYQLDFSSSADECGAALVSILSYPEPDVEEIVRGNLCISLCSLSLRALADLSLEQDLDWSISPQSIKPIYAFRDPNLINRDLRQLKRRLRDRMVAAKIAMPFLQEVATGHVPNLPKGVKRLSLNEMCSYVQDEVDQNDATNVETRIWRVSLPVIHLATAVAVVFNDLEKQGVRNLSIGHLITQPNLAKRIIDTSHEYAELLLKSSRITVAPDQLVYVYCR